MKKTEKFSKTMHYPRVRRYFIYTFVAVVFIFTLFTLYGRKGVEPVVTVKEEVKSAVPSPVKLEARDVKGSDDGAVRLFNGRMRNRDNLYDILTRQRVSPRIVTEVLTAARRVLDLRKLRVGNDYRLGFDEDGKLFFLEYEVDGLTYIRVERRDGIFMAKSGEISHQTREVTIFSEIDSSLYEAIIAKKESPLLALKLAEIFGWDIDFNTDLRRGDRFSLVLEKKERDGKSIGNGRILAAEFVNQGRSIRAIYYEDSSGRWDYFTEEGNSLRKQFLKAPLRYSYISSPYTLKRFHPILRIYRPHQGVDYAAPQGTPVVAIGDGQVISAGRKGWNGIFVKLKHNGTYSSSYGHLSQIAKGIREGVSVEQGQLIGYVGSTGLSTGPHLDFRVRKNGAYTNPLELEMPPARDVPAEELNTFAALRDRMLSLLSSAGGTMRAQDERGRQFE